MVQKTFTKALLDAGLRMPGETVGDFNKQMKALTLSEREWFRERFKIEHNIEVIS